MTRGNPIEIILTYDNFYCKGLFMSNSQTYKLADFLKSQTNFFIDFTVDLSRTSPTILKSQRCFFDLGVSIWTDFKMEGGRGWKNVDKYHNFLWYRSFENVRKGDFSMCLAVMHDSDSGIGIDSGITEIFDGIGIKKTRKYWNSLKSGQWTSCWNRNWNRNKTF